MKNWIIKKKWRITITGVLIATVPLAMFYAFIYYKIVTFLETKALKTEATLAKFAANTIDERLRPDISYGSLFAERILRTALVYLCNFTCYTCQPIDATIICRGERYV